MPQNKILNERGRSVQQSFQAFLEKTGKEDFIPFDENHPLWIPPKEKPGGWKIDVKPGFRHIPHSVHRPLIELSPTPQTPKKTEIIINGSKIVLSDDDESDGELKNLLQETPSKRGERSTLQVIQNTIRKLRDYQARRQTSQNSAGNSGMTVIDVGALDL